jgi:hypothetical protein
MASRELERLPFLASTTVEHFVALQFSLSVALQIKTREREK